MIHVICAYNTSPACTPDLGTKHGGDGPSHGICPACLAVELAALRNNQPLTSATTVYNIPLALSSTQGTAP